MRLSRIRLSAILPLILVAATGLLLGTLVSPPEAAANLISNGSFETGTNPPTTFVGVPPSVIDDWTATSQIEWVGPGLWTASDGVFSVDLSAGAPGVITTSFGTNPGTAYVLRFDLAGNPGGGPTLKETEVAVAGVTQTFAFDASGTSFTNMGWVTRSLHFTASSATTDLSFTGTSAGAFGAVVDNVSVDLPEPSVGVLLALGALGAYQWRRCTG